MTRVHELPSGDESDETQQAKFRQGYQDSIGPNRESPMVRAAKRVAIKHEIKLAGKYDKLGIKQAEQGKLKDAMDSHFEANDIRRWLKEQIPGGPPEGR